MRTGPISLLPGWRRLGAAPAALTLAERDRWPLWLAVLLGAGDALYFSLPAEPPPALAGWLMGLAGVFVLLAVWRGGPWRRALFCGLAALALGFALAKAREERMAAPILDRRMVAHFTARIDAIEARDTGVRLTLADPHSGAFDGHAVPRRIRLAIRSADFAPGQWMSVTAALAPPPLPSEPGAADFGRAAFFDGVGASGFAYGAAAPATAPRGSTISECISDAVEALRWGMTRRIHAALPGSDGAIASALITGMRGGIADEDEAALRDAGLAHVLAIAGLHMALVGMGLFWLVRALLALSPRLALEYPIKKWAAGAALCGAGFYLVISGAAPSATRAFVMLAAALVAVLLDRPALSMRAVALAAGVLLVARPETITEPGFQMSFAAVTALVAVAESVRLRGFWRVLPLTALVASLATLPVTLFHFGRAAYYAVLGNFIAMPVMGFAVMPLAALSVAAMPFGLEAWPLALLGHGIDAMLWMGRLVSGLPGAVSTTHAMPLVALVLIALGGLWLAIWRRRWRWLGVVPMLAGAIVTFTARPPDMLVAADAATVALRGGDGLLHFVPRPRDRFAARDWLVRDGDSRDLSQAIGMTGLKCDGEGCAAAMPGANMVAISRRAGSLTEDCRRATILVSAHDTDCAGPRWIADPQSAARDEGYALRFTPRLAVESVAAARGRRPWVRSSAAFNSGG